MALAYDADGNSGAPLADDSWTHVVGAGARCGVVLVIQSQGSQETVTATWDGASMTPLTVVDGSAAAEAAFIYPFIITGALGSGSKTIAFDGSGANVKVGASFSLIADADCEVDDSDSLVSSSQDDPSIALTASASAWTFAALHSGLGTASNVTAGADHTKTHGVSMTGDTGNFERRNSAASAGGVTVAFTTTAAEDAVMYAVAVRESSGAATVEGAAAPTGTGALTAAGMKEASGAAALSGSGALTAAGLQVASGAAALSGTGALTAAGDRVVDGAAALSGAGALTATGALDVIGAAALSGTGALTAAGFQTASGAATLTGTGALSAAGEVESISVTGAAVLTGTGSLTATGIAIVSGAAVLSGVGSLVAAGFGPTDPTPVSPNTLVLTPVSPAVL